MDDTGVALVDCIAAAGHSIANLSTLEGTLAADNVVLTAASAHNAPLWTWAVVVQVPVIWTVWYIQVRNTCRKEKKIKVNQAWRIHAQ